MLEVEMRTLQNTILRHLFSDLSWLPSIYFILDFSFQ